MVDGDSESESDDDSEDDPEVSDESEYTTGSGLLDEFEAKYGEVLIAFEAGSEATMIDFGFFGSGSEAVVLMDLFDGGEVDEFEAKYGEVLIAFEAGSEVVVLMDLRFFEAQSARA